MSLRASRRNFARAARGCHRRNMATTPIELAPAPPPPPRFALVASPVHTAILILMIVGVSLASANSQHKLAEHNGRIFLYLTTFVWEWLLCVVVLWGGKQRGVRLRDFINARW